MAEKNTNPDVIDTTEIGELLHKEYYDEKDPGVSIDYFMVMFGKPISSLPEISEKEFSQNIKKIGVDIKKLTDDGWEASKLRFFKFPQKKNERGQETEINSKVREVLKEFYQNKIQSTLPPSPDVGIIFTRACLYREEPKIVPQSNHIGAILRSKYQSKDTRIDYFYLFVQSEIGHDIHMIAHQELLKLQNVGEWREMAKQEWPGVFFGYYPKTAFMSEREREWSLNKQVREPLKKNIKQRFTNDEKEDPKVHIIIMRACLYIAEKRPNCTTQDQTSEQPMKKNV